MLSCLERTVYRIREVLYLNRNDHRRYIMFKRKRKLKFKLCAILFTLNIIAISITQPALASRVNGYEYLGKNLIGGIYNRTYYIGMGANSYIQPTLQAIEDWNWAVNPDDNGSDIDFYFKRTYTSSEATVSFWGENQPNARWSGYTRLYDASGHNLSNADSGWSFISSGWVRGSIIFNTDKSPTSYPSEMRKIAGHELGHFVGLGHTSDKGTLMYPYWNVCTTIVPTDYEVNATVYFYKYRVYSYK